MRPVIFAIPGDLSLPTGGYAYDRRILTGAAEHGLEMRHLALPGSFPQPTPEHLAETARLIAEAPANSVLFIDGLAYGAMPPGLIRAFARPIVALVHHPLGLETGVDAERARELIANEADALALADHVIVTSALTARTLANDFATPSSKITVAEPGVETAPRARGSKTAEVQIVSVGSVTPRKGYDLLVDALATLSDRRWRLKIAGAVDRAPETVAALQSQISARGLSDRIELLGAISDDDVSTLYDRADLFVLASHYEGYGMALAEAMTRGLPIIATTGGAAAETAPEGAAIKIPPGDGGALAAALSRALDDEHLRRRLAEKAWDAGQSLPRWSDTVARIANVLKNVKEAAP